MACAGCEHCGDGLYQLHITFKHNPGDIGVKVYELVDLLPSGKWKREWITGEDFTGTERDAKLAMARAIKAANVPDREVLRRKIEVPVKKLLGSDTPLYIEAHVKVVLTALNLELCITEGRNVSVNAAKPGRMILTFRRKRYKEVVEEIKAAKLERFYGFDPKKPIKYEAAIFDTNPELDNDWIAPTWRTGPQP